MRLHPFPYPGHRLLSGLRAWLRQRRYRPERHYMRGARPHAEA